MKPKIYRKFRIGNTLPSILMVAFAVAIFQTSCSKFNEDFNFDKLITPDWNPEFAIPLVNSTLAISDFFEDTSNLIITTAEDNSITFIYKSENIVSVTAESLITMKDQNFVFFNSFDLPGSGVGVIDTLEYADQFQFIPDTSAQSLDSIFFKGGYLNISGRSNLDRNTSKLELTSQSIRQISNNQPLVISANISNPSGAEWVYFDTTINLNDYKFILNQESDTLSNVMFVNQRIIITNDDNPDQSPYELIVEGTISDLEFKSVFGYLSQYEFPLADSIKIGLFDNVIGADFSLGDGAVKLKFNIDNSFGLPVTFFADTLYVFNPESNPQQVDIELFDPGIPNVFDINSPDLRQIGETVTNIIDFEETNFSEAINIFPKKLFYTMNAVTNFEPDKNGYNFLLDESAISIGVDLELNLFASVGEFMVEDTVSIDIDEGNDIEEVDYVTIRFNFTNAFPVDVTAQIYFADENYIVLDSLMKSGGNILPGAPVSGPPDYDVTAPISKITDFTLDRKGIENLFNSKYLFIRTAISTTEEQLVKFYPENYIGLKLGVISGLNVKSN
jgi:hypothetical protein